MRHGNEFNAKGTDIDAAAGRHHGHRNLRRIAFRRAFGLEQRRAELRGVDRAFQSRPQIDDRAEMILVGMSQHETNEVLSLFFEKPDVRHDEIDARQMLLVTEGHTEIDREPASLMAVAEPVDRQVHADLAHATERSKHQFIGPRYHVAPIDAAAPKYTSPAETATRLPSEVATIRQPSSSRVSKRPDIVDAPD